MLKLLLIKVDTMKLLNKTVKKEGTNMKKIFTTFAAIFTLLVIAPLSYAKDITNLDDLLSQLSEGKIAQSEQNIQRENEFELKVEKQDELLSSARNNRNNEVKTSNKLEKEFQQNEVDLGNQTEALNKRLGELKELFGVLQQVAGDTRSKFQTSVISAQIPDRDVFLNHFAQSMGSTSKLASIEEIERLWFELQREMTESGKVTRFKREVVLANGERVKKDIIRVGGFNLISEGKYLEYIDETGSVAELIRQPSSYYLDTSQALTNSKGETVAFALDPTGGSILSLLVQAPDLMERIEQGGTVGYVIIIIAIIGLFISAIRFVYLFLVGNKVNRQLKSETVSDDNPLGRVMLVKTKYAQANNETLELKLSESILKETPKLSSMLSLIKIISVVAPLIGLLGTVTGMINTFQAITLFGTGDPKLMAGGISQALVTTVLGLVAAIPMVFIHAFLHARSRNIINILQQESIGIIAERAEKGA